MIIGIMPIIPIINDGITKEIKEIIILIATNSPIPIYCPITT